MSTAVDTAFEAIVTAPGEAPEELHLVCGHCWPRCAPAVAVCGYVTSGKAPPANPVGQPRCPKCLSIDRLSPLPCGHP